MSRTAKMLLSLLVVAAICVPASASIETVCSPVASGGNNPIGAINQGWNLISLPAIPTNPDPGAVFDEFGGGLDGRMYRWDAATQSLTMYDVWAPEAFGNMLLTDGYWLDLSYVPQGQTNVCFEGITDNDNTDMWISLPKAGWSIIGCPFSYPVDMGTIEVTDGTVTVPIATARDNRWINTLGYWWDNSIPGGGGGSLKTMGLEDEWPETTTLEPWHGYWIQVLKDNIALIVPAASS